MKLRVRFIEKPGSPGIIEHHERADLEKMLTGSDAFVYINHERVSTDPLIIPDVFDDITVVILPQGGVAEGIGTALGLVFAWPLVVGYYLFKTVSGEINKYIQNQISSALDDIKTYSPTISRSIRGSRNSFRPDGLVPLILGNMYVVPDWCSRPYTSYVDDEQWFHQLFCFGYDEVTLSDLKIGDNPIANYDANYAEDLTYYPLLLSEIAINIELTYSGGPLTYTTPENTVQINVGLFFPAGLRQYDNDGNQQSYSVNFTIRYRVYGTSTWTEDNVTMSGNKDYARTMYEYVVSSEQYEVQVERTTSDTSSGQILDTSYWDVLQAHINNDGVTTPLSSGFQSACKILSLSIRATKQLNGIIDELNATAQLSCRDWNGLGSGSSYWIDGNTRNPASILLYVLTDSNANQRPISDSEIEWDEFEALHTWCVTKSFNFDATLTGDYTTGGVVRLLETAARFRLTKFNGVYGIRIEQASSSIDFLLTPRNTAGSMSMTKPFKATTKNLECTFIDRNSGYVEVTRTCSLTAANEIVFDNPQSGDTESIDFIGITDQDHMMMIAAFELAKYARRNISYTVPQDWEYLTAFPGAVGYLSNDMFLYSLGYGKVVSYTGSVGAITGIYVDFESTLEVGKSYAVIIRMNDETDGVQIININNPTGTGIKYFEFTSSVSYDIEEGNLVSFGEQGAEALKVICEKIQTGSEKTATLSLQPYAEEVYTADSGSIPAWSSGVTIPAAGGTGLTYDQIMTALIAEKAANQTLTPQFYTWIKYSANADGSDMTDVFVTDSTKYIGIAHNKLSSTESTNPADYEWSEYVGDGGYGIYLTIPTYTFQADSTGYVDEITIETEVKALKGGDVVDIVVSRLSAPSGMTIEQTGTLISITAEGSLMADSGYISIPVSIWVPVSGYVFGRDPDVYGRSPKVYGRTVNSPTATTFELAFSYAKASQGIQGEQGEQGIQAYRYVGKNYAAIATGMEINDFCLVYDENDDPIQRGLWVYDGTTYTRISDDTGPNAPYIAQALSDVLWSVNNGYGSVSDYGNIDYINNLVANNAFIAALGVQTITLLSGGVIKSTNYSSGISGLYMDGAGDAEFNSIRVRGFTMPSSGTSYSVTVASSGGDYTSISTALEDISRSIMNYKNGGITVEINIADNFVITENIEISGLNLGWITLQHASADTVYCSIDNTDPLFKLSAGAVGPILGFPDIVDTSYTDYGHTRNFLEIRDDSFCQMTTFNGTDFDRGVVLYDGSKLSATGLDLDISALSSCSETLLVQEGCIALVGTVTGVSGNYPYITINQGQVECAFTGAPSSTDYFLENYYGKASIEYVGPDTAVTLYVSYTKGGNTYVFCDALNPTIYNYLTFGAIVRVNTNGSPGNASTNISPNTLTSTGIYWES